MLGTFGTATWMFGPFIMVLGGVDRMAFVDGGGKTATDVGFMLEYQNFVMAALIHLYTRLFATPCSLHVKASNFL